jgi:hypothetical protein
MANPNIDVVVVVSGQEIGVKVNTHQTVDHLVREALKKSGNQGQPPDQWELRSIDGVLIPQNSSIEAAGIIDGAKLFLSPHAGAGGE